VEAVGEAISDTVDDRDTEKKLLVQTAYGMGTQVGLLLPFSRAQETQADSIGLMLMARSGYNPEEAPRFWKRFQSAGKAGIPELLSTHPADERRAENLIDLLPQAEQYYAAAEQKLDRGVAIANLLTGAKTNTVAKAAAPPAETPAPSAVVPANAFAPAATPAAEWIGAAPAANPQAAFTAPATQTPETDSGNPFLTPAATAAPAEEKGWGPTVH
jgi:predicted Zn-dependent protease